MLCQHEMSTGLPGVAGALPAQREILFVITIPSVVCRYIDPTSGWQRAD